MDEQVDSVAQRDDLVLSIVSDGTPAGTYIVDQDGRRVKNCTSIAVAIDRTDGVHARLEFIRMPLQLGLRPDDPNVRVVERVCEWSKPASELIEVGAS